MEYYNKALEINLKQFGEIHPDVATSYNNIGNIYDSEGKAQKALEYYNKSLNLKVKMFGKDHPSISTSLNNIGNIYES